MEMITIGCPNEHCQPYAEALCGAINRALTECPRDGRVTEVEECQTVIGALMGMGVAYAALLHGLTDQETRDLAEIVRQILLGRTEVEQTDPRGTNGR